MLPSKSTSMNASEILDYFLRTCHGQISNIILDFFDSSYIKQQLVDLFENCLENDIGAIQDLAIASLATTTMNLGLTLTDIINFLGIDYIALEMKESIIINELFDVVSDELRIHSSIISRSIINTIILPEKIFSVLKKIVFAADKMTSVNSRNSEILKAIISHSNFINFTKRKEGISATIKFYNDIRNTNFCQKSPFFWEQFASSCIDAKEFDTAKQCLEKAFLCADYIPGFVPFQVETVYAHYLLSKLNYDLTIIKQTSDKIISICIEASEHLLKHYSHSENNHFYIFKVWNIAVDIISVNISDFDSRQLSIILESIIIMNKYFNGFKSINETVFYQQIVGWDVKQNDCIEKIKRYIGKKSIPNR
jgi:hypothetical protein